MSYKTIVGNASIYSIFSIFSKGINFLLLPLYTAYLSTEDYGIVGIITALIAFLSTIYILSLQGAINRFYVEYINNKTKLGSLYSTIFITVILNATLWTIIALSSNKIFAKILPGIEFYPYVFWGLLTTWLKPLYILYQRILQAQQNGKKVVALDAGYTVVNVLLTIFFVVVLKQKAEGVIKSQTFAVLSIDIIILIIFLRKLKLRFNTDIFRRTMRYSLPLIPHSLAGVTSTMIDRFVINKFLGVAEVGVYNIAFQFGNLSNILTSAFNQAYIPWFNQQVKENKTELIKKVAQLATLVFSIFAMGISLFSDEVLRLFAEGDFLNGSKYIPYLAFAYVLNGIYFIFATDLFYDITGKGSQKLAIITVSSALINFILNMLLVPLWGISGAAIAFIFTKLYFALITGFSIRKRAFVQLNVFKLVFIALAFFILSLGTQILMLDLPLKMMIFLIVLAAVTIRYYKFLILKLLKR